MPQKLGKPLIKLIKRALKIMTAIFSIWVPGMIQIWNNFKNKGVKSSGGYSEIVFGKLKPNN